MFRRKIRVALDIGTSSLKVIQLEIAPTGVKLLNAGLIEIEHNPLATDEEKKAKIVEAIQHLLKEKHIKAKRITLAVPGQSVISRFLKLPPGSEGKVDRIIRYEARNQISLPLDKMVIDYQVLRQSRWGVDVILLAIKEKIVNDRLDLVDSIGLTPEVVDVTSLALFNSLTYGQESRKDEVVTFINIGATTTDLGIQKDGMLHFTRSFPIGGNDLTEALCARLGIDFLEAERLKREVTIPAESANKEEKAHRISEAIDSFLKALVAEIRHSFDYYQSQPDGALVNRIVLSGGGARLRGLDEFLARKLRLQVEIADPLKNIQFDPSRLNSEMASSLTIALGLALRGEVRTNLLPPKIRKEQKVKQQKRIFATATTSLITLLLMANIALSFQTSGIKKQLRKIKKEEATSLTVKRIQHLKKEDKKIKEKIALINSKMLEQAQWSPIIYEVSKITPDKIWLTEVATVKEQGGEERKTFQTEEGRRIEIKGSAFSHYRLSKFMANLENSSFFAKIILGSTQKIKDKGWIDFGITCQLARRSEK